MFRLTGNYIFMVLGAMAFTALLMVHQGALLADDSVPVERMVSEYTALAGSKENAQSLVEGLRTGREVKLISGAQTVTFTPPTKTMGNGNVDLALAMARISLAKSGIAGPTPSQLEAALVGGSITTASGTQTLAGVLSLRAQGKGWGVIADSLGLKVGELKRSDSAGPRSSSEGAKSPRRDKTASADKTTRVEKAERAARVECTERPQRPDRSERRH